MNGLPKFKIDIRILSTNNLKIFVASQDNSSHIYCLTLSDYSTLKALFYQLKSSTLSFSDDPCYSEYYADYKFINHLMKSNPLIISSFDELLKSYIFSLCLKESLIKKLNLPALSNEISFLELPANPKSIRILNSSDHDLLTFIKLAV